MAERYREPFVNPYIDEESNEARFSSVVTMDEIQERWRSGSWHAEEDNFQLSPSFFGEEQDAPSDGSDTGEEPGGNRFAFDLKRDILYGDDSDDAELDNSAYGDSYRPTGRLGSSISNIALERLKYNALADIKEELPEDLSYLYGSGGERRAKAKAQPKDRLYNRLDTPIEKRRAKVDQMLPQKRGETPEAIMEYVKKRRAAEDARAGIVRRPVPQVRRSSGLYDTFSAPGTIDEFSMDDSQTEYDVERVTERGSWRGDIPEQGGLVPDSRSMPYFGRFSRSWSKIDSLEPTRSEMLRHTVNTIYNDNSPDGGQRGAFRPNGKRRREYYVSDADFDPDDRYHRLPRKRRRIAASKDVLTESVMSGEFNNPYVDVSDERLKNILNHDMRGPGQLAEPEGLTDPALLYEWNMGYSRVNTDENKYSRWLADQGRLAEQAEQSRYRGSHRTGRPGAYLQREKPYGGERKYPRGERSVREVRRRDMQQQMQRATEQGMADGREMIRVQQEAELRAEKERLRREHMRQSAERKKQQQFYKQQQEQAAKRQQEILRQQQEQAAKQQEQLRQQREQAAKQQQEYIRRQQEYFKQQQAAAAKQQQEYIKRQQEYMKQQQAQNGGYPQPPQGYYPQGNAQQPPQGYYPQGNAQQPPQGYYPQGSPQQPSQGYYPQGNGGR